MAITEKIAQALEKKVMIEITGELVTVVDDTRKDKFRAQRGKTFTGICKTRNVALTAIDARYKGENVRLIFPTAHIALAILLNQN